MQIRNSIYRAALCLASIACTPGVWATTNATTNGCGSPAFGSVSGGGVSITVDCSTKNVYGNRRTSKYERDMHALLLAQNPTEVQISKLDLMAWLEDRDRVSLNVGLTNPRNIPIASVAVDILDPTTGASYFAQKPFKLERSNIYRILNSTKVSMPANATTKLPLGFLEEIQNSVHHVSESYCPFDATPGLGNGFLTDEYMAARQEAAEKRRLGDPTGSMHTVSVPLTLRITVESIFGQKLVSHAMASIHYAERNGKLDIWYPSKKVLGPLECIKERVSL